LLLITRPTSMFDTPVVPCSTHNPTRCQNPRTFNSANTQADTFLIHISESEV